MTETITIPLNKLLAWEGNVRKTDPDKGIDELAASISAHGLLQSLVVRKDRRGKYAVVAGRRRLLALKSLAEAGGIEADRLVTCTVLGDEADSTEISVAENAQRESMHPADKFDAFKALIESGVRVADVAARFGVTEAVVSKLVGVGEFPGGGIFNRRTGQASGTFIPGKRASAIAASRAARRHGSGRGERPSRSTVQPPASSANVTDKVSATGNGSVAENHQSQKQLTRPRG